jgi:hypothetical protein
MSSDSIRIAFEALDARDVEPLVALMHPEPAGRGLLPGRAIRSLTGFGTGFSAAEGISPQSQRTEPEPKSRDAKTRCGARAAASRLT